MIDGRCGCCGDAPSSGGCARCNSSQTYCACGALIRCGCGATHRHDCPSIRSVVGVFVPIDFVLVTGSSG